MRSRVLISKCEDLSSCTGGILHRLRCRLPSLHSSLLLEGPVAPPRGTRGKLCGGKSACTPGICTSCIPRTSVFHVPVAVEAQLERMLPPLALDQDGELRVGRRVVEERLLPRLAGGPHDPAAMIKPLRWLRRRLRKVSGGEFQDENTTPREKSVKCF